MKVMSALLAISAAMLVALTLTANADDIRAQLKGTWSGEWTPDGGVRDSMTIELRYDDAGRLTGRFVTPNPVEFNKATFNPKTRMLLIEAADASGKQYKLDAKVEGTEIKGTANLGNLRGQIHLIKWTYVPPITPYRY